MKFDLLLSEKLGRDTYISHNGGIFIKTGSNTHHIGTTASSIAELRFNMNQYI